MTATINKEEIINDTPAEILFISALMDTGTYVPGTYGITTEKIDRFRNVHDYCLEHQEKDHKAPTPQLIKKKFPKFPYIANVGIKFAANRLHEEHRTRVLQTALGSAAHSLTEEANDEAVALLKQALSKVQPLAGNGVSAYDYSLFDEDNDIDMCAVPKGPIRNITGGIAPGDLWFVAARMGVGKSWRLVEHAVAAAESGWNIIYFSLEMTEREVIDRIHRVALSGWKNKWGEIKLDQRVSLFDEFKEANKVQIDVYSKDLKRRDPTMVETYAKEKTLYLIDHVGLMSTESGSRSVEDWRAMAQISNQLKEVALQQNVPIIAGAQVNRAGNSSTSAPGAEHLAQSDALGQDADAVITLMKQSERVTLNSMAKYRHGKSGSKWYTLFEPDFGNFEVLTPEEAYKIKMVDEASAGEEI